MFKHKISCSFSGLATARVEIKSTRVLPVIARAWLRHWDDEEAAKALNNYFSSVFTLEDLGSIPEPKQALVDIGKGLTQIVFTKENVVEQWVMKRKRIYCRKT